MTAETKSPLPESVEKCLETVEYFYTSSYRDAQRQNRDNGPNIWQHEADCINTLRAHISALTAELETYRRNDAGGCYSNRTDRETD